MGKQVVFNVNKGILELVHQYLLQQGLVLTEVQTELEHGHWASVRFSELPIAEIACANKMTTYYITHPATQAPQGKEEVLDFTGNETTFIELTFYFPNMAGYDSRIWFEPSDHCLAKEGNTLLKKIRSWAKKTGEQGSKPQRKPLSATKGLMAQK